MCSSTERGKGLIRIGVDVLWVVIEGNQTGSEEENIRLSSAFASFYHYIYSEIFL